MKRAYRNLLPHWPMCLFLGLILVFGSTMPVWAQFTTAGLNGIVSDPSNAVVAGATVIVQDVGTGYSQTTKTGPAGQYLFPSLPVGTYQFTVSMTGYAQYVQKGIELSVGQAATQNVQLILGSVGQQIVVTANSSLVTTDSPTVGQLINQQEISGLPLNGREVQQLVFLAPGATDVTSHYCAANCEGGVLASEQYANVNGGGSNGVYYQLDGVDYNDTYLNTNEPFPNPDAVQEFNLVTGNMSASYENAIGGVVNVVTKSGTDKIHGDAFEFLRNAAFDAKNYFSTIVSPLKQNQFGGSVGGPILKQHLFYFGSYQGIRLRSASNGQIQFVPNAAERTGDFSDLLPGTQLVNPNTGAPYANNQIPVSPVATYILNHIPLPNGPNDQLTYNGGPDLQNTDEYLGKLDFNAGKHHLSGHYFQMNYSDPIYTTSTNLLNLRNDAERLVATNISIGDTYSITHNLLLSSYFGYNTQNGNSLSPAPFSMADAGVKMAVPPNLGGGNAPVLTIVVGGDFNTSDATGYGTWNRGQQSLRENLMWMKGTHELQFGGEITRIRLPNGDQYSESGMFDFWSDLTGNNMADFELGAMSSFTQGAGYYVNMTGYKESLFVQDNWRITPRLTFNAGLRWDPFFPYTDSLGRAACFVPGAATSRRFPNAPAGMLFGGKDHDPGCPASSIYNNLNNYGPRLGFAYQVTEDGNTSIRGGAGYYYQAPNTVDWSDISGVAPFAPNINLTNVSLADPYGSAGIADPFPAQFGPLNPGPNATFPQDISFSYIFDRHFRLPMVLAYNLTAEHGFKKDWMLRLAYVGNDGHHLNGTGDQENGMLQLNPAIYIPGQSTEANEQQRRRYPDYGSMASIQSGINSTYNAAQITLEKRMTRGFSFLTDFTWAKALNDFAPIGSPFGTNSCSCGRSFDSGLSNDDLSKTFKINGDYLVPHVSLPRGVDKVVNGWELTAIANWHTGFPFTIFSGYDNSLSGMGADRADLTVPSVQNAVLSTGRSHAAQVSEWFNVSAFGPNQIGSFGDTGKNILRGPRYMDGDLAAIKNTKINDRLSLQLRGEFFNAFNNVNFGTPGNTLTSSGFGQITGLTGQPRIIQLAVKAEF
jgi:hypothetical protein